MKDLVDALISEYVIKASLTRLFLLFPFLGWFPINIFVQFIVNKYSKILIEDVNLKIDISEILNNNHNLRKTFDNETVKLMILEDNYGVDSVEYKAGLNASKKAFRDFINLNNN